MPEVEIPIFRKRRRRTRTFDLERDNMPAVLAALSGLLAPPGTFVPTALQDQPEGDGWILCDGRAVSKTEFPRLYEIFGARYGESGDTFNVPDLRGKTVMGTRDDLDLGAFGGARTVTLSVNQLPPHDHTFTGNPHDHAFTGDPHDHAVSDPGHSHDYDAVQDAPSNGIASGSDLPGRVATTGTTASAQTGVSVNEATATGTVGETTATGTVGSTGGGQPVDLTPPVLGVNWLVRA